MKTKEALAAALLLLLPATIMAQDVLKIGLFNKDAVIIAADAKGLLKDENIRIEINPVTDSPTLLRNLIKGNYHVILNNADNVIAWAEGQGEDPQKNDFIIFLGGSRGVDQKLIVAPDINDYADLKGKIFAVRRADHGLRDRRRLHPEKAWPGMEPGLYDEGFRQYRRTRQRHESR